MSPRFCGNCGTPLGPAGRFCEACGAAALPDAPPPAQARQQLSKASGAGILVPLAITAVVAAVVVGAFLALSGSSGDDKDGTAAGGRSAVGSLSVSLPEGWQTTGISDRRMLAANGADLVTDAIKGPRVEMRVFSGAEDIATEVQTALVKGNAPLAQFSVDIADEPADIAVGASLGTAITLLHSRGGVFYLARYISLSDGSRGYLIVQEAPEDQWDAALPAFEEMLRTATVSR